MGRTLGPKIPAGTDLHGGVRTSTFEILQRVQSILERYGFTEEGLPPWQAQQDDGADSAPDAGHGSDPDAFLISGPDWAPVGDQPQPGDAEPPAVATEGLERASPDVADRAGAIADVISVEFDGFQLQLDRVFLGHSHHNQDVDGWFLTL